MKRAAKAGCLVLLFLTIGCSHIAFLGKSPRPSKNTIGPSKLKQPLESNNFVEKGQIIDVPRLQQGTNIAIIPFKAGVGVEANEELDKIALMIVKGVADVFADDQESRFNILTAENSQEADFIIQGHITGVKGPSRVSRWILFKGQKTLDVDGKMVDAQTGETIAVFADKTETKEADYKELGYRIGKNIGLFIVSGVE